MDFFKSDLKRICLLTGLRRSRKLFVDITRLERYTETHNQLRAKHKKRDPVSRNPLFLLTPFVQRRSYMIYFKRTRCHPRGTFVKFYLKQGASYV